MQAEGARLSSLNNSLEDLCLLKGQEGRKEGKEGGKEEKELLLDRNSVAGTRFEKATKARLATALCFVFIL